MATLTPITVSLTTLVVIASAAEVMLQSGATIKEISGHLRGLALGVFTVDVRAKSDSRLMGSLSWVPGDTPGPKIVAGLNEWLETGDSIVFAVSSAGVSAAGCTLTAWVQ